jgi:hypothetical protein
MSGQPPGALTLPSVTYETYFLGLAVKSARHPGEQKKYDFPFHSVLYLAVFSSTDIPQTGSLAMKSPIAAA